MPTKKTDNKTTASDLSVEAFLENTFSQAQKEDASALASLMQKITGFPPKMWGASIVGFGTYHYKYGSGREGDMPLVSFSPRKQNITLYLGLSNENIQGLPELLGKLGKHKVGKGCLYLNSLSDVDISVLEGIIVNSMERYSEK
jgi:hypothetical protein